ncbi:3-isopropylmalate dehydratase large subunit [Alicyclobacillus cycloheptanicus]|uniref:3-isopropylmalate dehydratase large subunit n=1 Tax=Alicyclobacillus cycloheptanicus TaxID=1457 RepID=A0ABT9XHW3_9BACL|nr:3-isopropylmalate dehydratase large subunit [Alicyclobacillus cycloheptanicus]MDQ0189908.1 3-isopropylmalate/(R)-2-methylmalate dehydratase large subunit [Alicyclobacillus cycloheptanicus]WDM02188.1 3-isopropylmalate dehydratase large subunit [Alicyclobacillus cycloheptanicus]
MGKTLVQKIAERASGVKDVQPGMIVTVNVDIAMMHDSTGPRRIGKTMEKLGRKVWNPDKVVLITDHFTPANDSVEAEILRITREFAKAQGIKRFHEAEGICHIVPVEMGYVRPGMMYVGADSHSTTAGAVGAFAIAVGSTDMLGIMVTGQTWIKVPETIRVTWKGNLPKGAMAKDMMLALISKMGGDGATYQAVEYTGTAVERLSMDERLVLSNMSIELGAKAGVIAPNQIVFDYLAERGVTEFDAVYADGDANYIREVVMDASALRPLVAKPHAPENVDTAKNLEDEGVRIHQAYIGACTGAKFTDLEAAAQVLRGRHVAPGVRLLVAPASVRVFRQAVEAGIVTTLLEAGAQFLPTGCGACAGLGHGILAAGEVCISSTNRNFPGRMGNRQSSVYLGSPATVAASAVAGYVADPATVAGTDAIGTEVAAVARGVAE